MNKPDLRTVIESAVGTPGRGGKYNCPFHQEKTPSFTIRGQRFKCFGCGASGDVIDFVRQLYGLSYPDALKHLGIERGKPARPDPTIEKRKKLRAAFEKWRRSYYNSLADTSIRLHKLELTVKDRRTPLSEPLAWTYAETIARLPEVDHKLDLLFNGDDEDAFKLFCEVQCR